MAVSPINRLMKKKANSRQETQEKVQKKKQGTVDDTWYEEIDSFRENLPKLINALIGGEGDAYTKDPKMQTFYEVLTTHNNSGIL